MSEIAMIGENGDPKSEKAYGLYLAGYNNREISEMLEVSVHEAAKLIQAEIAYMNSRMSADERIHRHRIEAARLDALMKAHWKTALQGPVHLADGEVDAKTSIDAAKLVLAVIDRRIKLYGLDKPMEDQSQKVLLINNATKDEFMDILRQAQIRDADTDILEGEIEEEE